ncbi:MAG TPA: hypothetical protein VEW42_05450 [Candidatus Eisenbacteria bacterium]|nr:hypothetical protein [Candidatus Eisenbacteria bacterium]
MRVEENTEFGEESTGDYQGSARHRIARWVRNSGRGRVHSRADLSGDTQANRAKTKVLYAPKRLRHAKYTHA